MAWNDNVIPSLTNNYARTASANAKPYSGIIMHVTGKQTLADELNWMKTNGQGLGYHYIIDRDGKIYQTAPLDKRMNQALPDLDKSYNNNNSLGVAMVAGGTPGDEPPAFSSAQLEAGKTLVDGLRSQYNIPTNRVAGHGQIQTDREAGNKLNAGGGYEGQDFINYYNKGAPSSDGTAPAPRAVAGTSINTTGPSRPGNYGQSGIELLNAELAKRGISPAAASGAIAGIMGESGANLDPTSFNSKDPGGGSGGIGQWNRGRLVGPGGMLAFAKNAGVNVDPTNPLDAKKVPLATQVQYLGHELDTTYSGVAKQLQAAQTPQDALNIWVNSYENPADKAGAIAQRSQYLAPVGAALSGGAPTSPGPPGPGGWDPTTATPGTTINSTPAGVTQGQLGQLAQNVKSFGKALGLPDDDAKDGQQQMRPLQAPPAPGARNVSPLLGNPQLYAQRMAALNQPMTWGAAPPGQMMGTGFGPQNQPVYGTSLMSMLNDWQGGG